MQESLGRSHSIRGSMRFLHSEVNTIKLFNCNLPTSVLLDRDGLQLGSKDSYWNQLFLNTPVSTHLEMVYMVVTHSLIMKEMRKKQAGLGQLKTGSLLAVTFLLTFAVVKF